ncbi:hypothetical protein NC653_019794 [Populus alba x Populus x berolinensis]|uniref:Uncharacterized protein n=1 Tax=Populus alba x Populus x berolinensis TaxID=444605 RepID=A0AAD6QBR3_9ROSI|nr:hypothetical protein NC653_019794 [Populus alba x Populus x berolinensis]
MNLAAHDWHARIVILLIQRCWRQDRKHTSTLQKIYDLYSFKRGDKSSRIPYSRGESSTGASTTSFRRWSH